MKTETGKVSIAQLVGAFKDQRATVNAEKVEAKNAAKQQRAELYRAQLTSLEKLLPNIQEVFNMGPGDSAQVEISPGYVSDHHNHDRHLQGAVDYPERSREP